MFFPSGVIDTRPTFQDVLGGRRHPSKGLQAWAPSKGKYGAFNYVVLFLCRSDWIGHVKSGIQELDWRVVILKACWWRICRAKGNTVLLVMSCFFCVEVIGLGM